MKRKEMLYRDSLHQFKNAYEPFREISIKKFKIHMRNFLFVTIICLSLSNRKLQRFLKRQDIYFVPVNI